MEIIAKQIIGATSIPILIVGILGITSTDPVQFFASIGMIVFGVIMLLLYSIALIEKRVDKINQK